MRHLTIPTSPEEHCGQLAAALGPIANHGHWQALVHHLVANRAPLLYTGTTSEEMQNLSNWFNLINTRAGWYSPAQDIISNLYIAHELAHLITITPHDLDRDSFAEAFHQSERLASYETELRIHDDLGELRQLVPWRPLLAHWLQVRGVNLADAEMLMDWRDRVIANPDLLDELPSEAARLSTYGDNHGWARNYWDQLASHGIWEALPAFEHTGFTPTDYRHHIAQAAKSPIDRDRWESVVSDNVRRAFVLSGLDDPGHRAFGELGELVRVLDGRQLAGTPTP